MGKLLLLLLASLVVTAEPGAASTVEAVAAVNKHMPWNSDSVPAPQRREIATALADYWASFASRIPRISPAERQWVEGEINTTDMTRIGAILSRREYALYSLLREAEDCRDAHFQLAEAVGRNERDEAVRWVKTLNCYRDADRRLSSLVLAGLQPTGKYDGAFNIALFSLWSGFIINQIVPSALSGR